MHAMRVYTAGTRVPFVPSYPLRLQRLLAVACGYTHLNSFDPTSIPNDHLQLCFLER